MKQATSLTTVLVLSLTLGVHAASVGTFDGGDAGEGLDLDGVFVYAVSVGHNTTGGAAGPDLPVGDAVFKDNFAGVNLIPGTAPFWQSLNNWGTVPALGATANDNNLEAVLHDIGIPSAGRLSNSFEVVVGQTYKVQIILSENHYSGTNFGAQTREQDIVIYDGTYNDTVGTGRTVFDTVSNLNVTSETGGWVGNPDEGVVVTSEFTAISNWVTISTHAPAIPTGGLDTTAIFNAVTLEAQSENGAFKILHNSSELDTSGAAYAVNVSSDAVVRNVNGLDFHPSDALGGVPGVTIGASLPVNGWGTIPNLGATAGDNQLEAVMHDIRYAATGDLNIDATVSAGRYEVTLLFSENFFNAADARSFDIAIEGVTLVDELDIFEAAGGQSRVLAFIYEVVVEDGNLDIDLLRGSTTSDTNPLINAFVIRTIPAPAALPAGLVMLGLIGARRRRRI